MSKRASLSLSELAWARVREGDLGGAFRLLWEAEEPAAEQERLATRAELQAYCGNEEAALTLAADIQKPQDAALVRARVAASRGDWESSLEYAERCFDLPRLQASGRMLAARALAELDRLEDATRVLDGLESEAGSSDWSAKLVRARAAPDPSAAISSIADRARAERALLAEADAFADLGLARREALWQVRAIKGDRPLPLFEGLESEGEEGVVLLPPMTLGEEVVADYSALRLTLRAHPMALIRPLLEVRETA